MENMQTDSSIIQKNKTINVVHSKFSTDKSENWKFLSQIVAGGRNCSETSSTTKPKRLTFKSTWFMGKANTEW